MKHFLRILISLYVSILLTGCNSKEISPLFFKDEEVSTSISANNDEFTDLSYTIDKITLSKSYQSIEPNIKIIKDGLDSNLLLSLGIVDSSGINIEKIERNNRDVNIYIQNEDKHIKEEFVVPQIIVHFDDLSTKDLEELNFKIINQNYEPIKSNIDISEAISKVKSSLKINTSTFPNSSIVKEDNNMFLMLDFMNAVDLKNDENPIINLNVLIDLVDGKIVDSTKSSVSSLIDEGIILEYLTNKYILYVKEEKKLGNERYELWIYDIEKDSRDKIRTFKNKISSLKFNQKGDKAFLIESLEGSNRLHLLELENLKISRVDLDKDINPCIGVWRGKDVIFLDRKDKGALLYTLDVSNDNLSFISTVDKDIREIQYLKDNFLFSTIKDDVKNIYTTKDFKENKLIDVGEKPLFLDDNTICYMKNENNTSKNVLWFYSLNDASLESYSDIDVKDFFIWKDSLAIIEKTQVGPENPLYIYNLKNQTTVFISSIKSDKIFLNTKDDILYINSSIDVEKDKKSIISFIKLEK